MSTSDWPFTGRESELELISECTSGVLVSGPAGVGKTRLAAGAMRGPSCARVRGARVLQEVPYGAFTHLLDGPVRSFALAASTLRTIRTLVVDDAHLLDPWSAALVQHLAEGRRTKLIVTVRPGHVPDPIAALSKEHLLERLELSALPLADMASLLESVMGGHVEMLTVQRLRDETQGNLRFLKELTGTFKQEGGVWHVRGPLSLSPALRDLLAADLGPLTSDERLALAHVAFAGTLDTSMFVDLTVPLEHLEERGILEPVAGPGPLLRIAHPLHAEYARTTCGALRASRLQALFKRPLPTPEPSGEELELAENHFYDLLLTADLAEAHTFADAGLDAAETDEEIGHYSALKAMALRLSGDTKAAHGWAMDASLRTRSPLVEAELARTSALRGEIASDNVLEAAIRAVRASERHSHPVLYAFALHDLIRLGAPPETATEAATKLRTLPGSLPTLLADHAAAYATSKGHSLAETAGHLASLGFSLFAAEAAAQASSLLRRLGAHRHARAAASFAWSQSRVSSGTHSPALAALAAPDLTDRQLEVAHLAISGLTNREIAEHLGVSIRTAANHLCHIYDTLGVRDRSDLRRLLAPPSTAMRPTRVFDSLG